MATRVGAEAVPADGSRPLQNTGANDVSMDVSFVFGDAQKVGAAEAERAAIVWDSLGFGGGVRADALAAVALAAPPGCVLVTYDALPEDPRLAKFEALGEALVLPNSWTAKQRYYLYAVAGGAADEKLHAAPLTPTADEGVIAVAASHEGFRHPDAATPDGAAPEEGSALVLDDLGKALGTDAVRGFL